MEMNEKAVGSSFDDFLASEGILNEVTALAHKRVLAWKIAQAMQNQKVTQVEMARRMRTSRTAIQRLLDPENPSITLDTLGRATNALGLKLEISIY
jgi:hypothetical protein